jgi:hypothetical protein
MPVSNLFAVEVNLLSSHSLAKSFITPIEKTSFMKLTNSASLTQVSKVALGISIWSWPRTDCQEELGSINNLPKGNPNKTLENNRGCKGIDFV